MTYNNILCIQKKRMLLTIVLMSLMCMVLAYYFSTPSSRTTYVTELARINDIEDKVVVIGTATASQLVTVGSQASGQIKKIHVQLGDSVKKGQLLAEIDSTTQINELSTSRARLKSYEAQLEARKVSLKIASTQYARWAVLLKSDATSQDNFENAENDWEKAKADVAETESLILQAKIAVGTAEANCGYTRIIAPMDGVVVSTPVEEGQTINATQVTPVIVQLADLSIMSIRMQISEADVTKLRPGMAVTCAILSEQTVEYPTVLHSIDPADVSTTDNIKNSDKMNAIKSDSAIYYYGRALVENNDGKLRIGMTTKNSIILRIKENVITVSNASIYERDAKKYIRILHDDDRSQEIEVSIGIADDSRTEVILGLAGGERVVTSEITDDEINDSVNKVIN